MNTQENGDHMDIDIFRSARVIITGGLGFIGSNLARRLVETGARVRIVDSLVPEYGGNLFNVAGIEDKLDINISDVRDPHSLPHLVRDGDFLFNLAGQTSHMDSMTDPFTDLEINCSAQLSILETCRKANPDLKIVYASTRQIYGKPDFLPVTEDHPLRPTDVNGINKMAGEWYHLLYNNVHGIRACVLRLTNTIGPRMRIRDARQTFLGIWIRRLLEKKRFEVWGGEQLRDFTYVDDCVDAMLLAAGSEESNGRVFNLGGAEVVTLRRLADLLVGCHGSGGYDCLPFPEDRKKIDIGDYYSDFGRIESILGWHPKVGLETALEKTLAFFRKNLEHYR
jgi:UDP-glucose 4-epimerase